MKKLLYLSIASALLMVGGCAKEPVVDNGLVDNDVPENNVTEQQPVEIAMKTIDLGASMSDLESPVKAVAGDDGAFGWTSDDAIAVNVVYTDGNGDEVNGFFRFDVKEISSEDDNVATFTGEIPETGTVSGVAVYPYDEGHSFVDGKLIVNFPSEVSEANHLPVMYARVSDGESMNFNHLSSMLKVTYRYVPKGTDGFVLTSDAVAGPYEVDVETGELTATSEATDNVKVPFTALPTMYSDKSVYVPVPAGERIFAVQLNKGDEKVKWSDFSTKSAREYAAGRIALLPAMDVHLENLFVLGDSKDMWKWNYELMEPMEEAEDHVFTWSGKVSEGDEFRFPVERYWWPAIYKEGETGGRIVLANPAAPTADPKGTDFVAAKSGSYTITVDARDMDAIKVTVNLDKEHEIYPDLYIVGSATDWGYTTKPVDEQWMDQTENGIFVWEGHLSNSGEFKFYIGSDHVPSYNRDGSAADYWTLVYRAAYQDANKKDTPDLKFKIEKSGTYRLTADLNTMKLTPELLVEDAYQKLYGIGSAFEAGWDLKKAEELEYKGNGVYTWTGTITAGGEFKFLLQRDWGAHYGPDKSKDGTYEVDGTTALHNSGDVKYTLPSDYATGIYTVTLDISNGTITVTPQE